MCRASATLILAPMTKPLIFRGQARLNGAEEHKFPDLNGTPGLGPVGRPKPSNASLSGTMNSGFSGNNVRQIV